MKNSDQRRGQGAQGGRGRGNQGGVVGYSVEQAGELLGISRSSAYAAIASGDIPSVRVGHLLIVPRQRFHEKFGALPEGTAAA
jgi:excisionase family DNA binding protein